MGGLRDVDGVAKRALAARGDTPKSLLYMLYRSDDPLIRKRVAANKNADDEVLSRLAYDQDSYIRAAVAGNESTPQDVLRMLSQDEDPFVQLALAGNQNAPTDILETMVRYTRRKPISRGDHVRADLPRGIDIAVAASRNSNMPVGWLIDCMRAGKEWAKVLVAGNPNTPEALLLELADDALGSVCEAVASNEGLSGGAIEALFYRHKLAERLIAANPNTPGNILSSLSVHAYYPAGGWVAVAVAGNPSTPASTLRKLATPFKFDHDDDWSDRSRKAAINAAAASNPSTPLDALELLMAARLYNGIAKNPNATPEMLKKILDSISWLDQGGRDTFEVYSNPSFDLFGYLDVNTADEELLARWMVEGYSYSGRVASLSSVESIRSGLAQLDALSKRQNVSSKTLDEIAHEGDELTRTYVAHNPNAVLETIGMLAVDASDQVRAAVAKRADLTRELFEGLLDDRGFSVCHAASNNEKMIISVSETIEFSEDRIALVRALAGNPNVNERVIRRIYQSEQVKSCESLIAANPNTPRDILSELARSKNENVLTALAANPNAGEELLIFLSGLRIWKVRNAIVKNPHAPKTLLEKYAQVNPVAIDFAQSSMTPQAVFEKIESEGNEYCRFALAANSAIPYALLLRLVEDDDPVIRGYVAENDRADDDFLRVLANDEEEYVRIRVAANHNLSPAVMRLLASDDSLLVRLNLARHARLPLELVDKFSEDECPLIRKEIASRKDVWLSVLKRLVDDESDFVREAVLANSIFPEPGVLWGKVI